MALSQWRFLLCLAEFWRDHHPAFGVAALLTKQELQSLTESEAARICVVSLGCNAVSYASKKQDPTESQTCFVSGGPWDPSVKEEVSVAPQCHTGRVPLFVRWTCESRSPPRS